MPCGLISELAASAALLRFALQLAAQSERRARAGLADEQHLALVIGDLVDAELPGQARRGVGRQWFPGFVEAQPDCHGYLPLLISR